MDKKYTVQSVKTVIEKIVKTGLSDDVELNEELLDVLDSINENDLVSAALQLSVAALNYLPSFGEKLCPLRIDSCKMMGLMSVVLWNAALDTTNRDIS